MTVVRSAVLGEEAFIPKADRKSFFALHTFILNFAPGNVQLQSIKNEWIFS